MGRILLYDPLNFKAVFIAKYFRDLSPTVLDFDSKQKFKPFFYFELCIKRG